MTTNIERIGNATSSEIVALTTSGTKAGSFGDPFYTYIEEINMERLLGRSIDDEKNAKPMVWGKVLEPYVFDKLGPEYTFSSNITKLHPTVSGWAGSDDGTIEGAKRGVYDFKCPFTLKSFCQLVQPLYDGLTGMAAMNAIRFGYTDPRGLKHKKHKDGEKFYWQLVSNSCIQDVPDAELIVYVPYESEIPEIKAMVDGNPAAYFIWSAGTNELPFLKDNGYYKNLNKIRFEVPQEDKDFLTTRVLEASKYFIPPFPSNQVIEPYIASFDNDVKAMIIE